MTISNVLNQLQRDLKLFKDTPIDYLYTFTSSNEEKVRIKPFNPKDKEFGQKLVRKIKLQLPDLKVNFIGSAALGIPGHKDIDLVAQSKPKKFGKYAPKLTAIFGQPAKVKSQFIEWRTELDGYRIELVLTDPKSRIFKELVSVYEELKKSKELRDEYEFIKLSSQGQSIREYNRRRLEFFNKVMEKKPN